MSPPSTERKYALRKLSQGDYLLPSNDRHTFWRICIGEEANENDVGKPHRIWELWRWIGTPDPEAVALSIVEDHSSWTNHWECCSFGLPTRADAIKEAMRL